MILKTDYPNDPGLVFYDWYKLEEPNPDYYVRPYVARTTEDATVTIFAKDYEHGMVLAQSSNNDILYGSIDINNNFIPATIVDIILLIKFLKGGLGYIL